MKVHELIELLGSFDPNDEVFTIDTCECHTRFQPLMTAGVGKRMVGAHAANPRHNPERNPIPMSEERIATEEKIPGVVITSPGWADHYPKVEANEGTRTKTRG